MEFSMSGIFPVEFPYHRSKRTQARHMFFRVFDEMFLNDSSPVPAWEKAAPVAFWDKYQKLLVCSCITYAITYIQLYIPINLYFFAQFFHDVYSGAFIILFGWYRGVRQALGCSMQINQSPRLMI